MSAIIPKDLTPCRPEQRHDQEKKDSFGHSREYRLVDEKMIPPLIYSTPHPLKIPSHYEVPKMSSASLILRSLAPSAQEDSQLEYQADCSTSSRYLSIPLDRLDPGS